MCLETSQETLWLDQREQGEERHREGPPQVRLWVLLHAFTDSTVRVGGKLQDFGQRDAHNMPFILLCSVTSDVDLQNMIVRTASGNREQN